MSRSTTHLAILGTSLGLCFAAATLNAQDVSPRPPGKVAPAAGPAMRWYKGNTHTHTLNSDGDSTPDDVVRWYREHGYQFLVLTDHNFVTSVDGLNALHGADERFLVIRGEEVTSRAGDKPIHVNGLDVERRVEPATGSSVGEVLQRAVDGIRGASGVPHINHPNFGWAITGQELQQVRNNQPLRDLQRPPAGQQRGRRRRSRTGRGVGPDPHERHDALWDRSGRCPPFQAAGKSAGVGARPRLGDDSRGAARDEGAPGSAGEREFLRLHRRGAG